MRGAADGGMSCRDGETDRATELQGRKAGRLSAVSGQHGWWPKPRNHQSGLGAVEGGLPVLVEG